MTEAQAAYRAYIATSDRASAIGNRSLALSVVDDVQAGHRRTPSSRSRGVNARRPPYPRYSYGAPAIFLPGGIAGGNPQYFVADVTRTPVPGTVAMTPSSQDVTAGVQLPSAGRVLMVFEKPGPGHLWWVASVSQLAPGATVPALATDSNGYVITERFSSPGAALLVRPALAPPLQATVVDDGPASAASAVVANGPLTTGLYQSAVSSAQGITAPPGDVHQWLLEGASYGRLALKTTDGGVLVLYSMYLNDTVETMSVLNQAIPVLPGPPISVPDYVKPLLRHPDSIPRTRLQIQEILSFAAIDPPRPPQRGGEDPGHRHRRRPPHGQCPMIFVTPAR